MTRDLRRWAIMPVLALGVALIIVDSTIVNVALPRIVPALDMNLVAAEWVNSSYSLVFAALLVAVGAIADRVGRRRMFMLGVVVFAVASLFAGAAMSSSMMILARMLQGVGPAPGQGMRGAYQRCTPGRKDLVDPPQLGGILWRWRDRGHWCGAAMSIDGGRAIRLGDLLVASILRAGDPVDGWHRIDVLPGHDGR